MPGMSGIELTTWMRARPALNELAVVIISNSPAPLDEAHARTAGALHFLPRYLSSEVPRTLVASLPSGPR